MPNQPFLSIPECYRIAWRAFAKWWIPLCLISGGILVFELVPRFLARDQRQQVWRSCMIVGKAVLSRDRAALERAALDVRDDAEAFAAAVARYTAMALPIVAVLWSVLLLFANRAVKDRCDKRRFKRVLLVAIWRLTLAALKIAPLLAALAYILYLRFGNGTYQDVRWGVLLCLVLVSPFWFLYTYARLYFVPLLMFEFDLGGWHACRQGWAQTRGFFLKLLAIILINAVVQSILGLTIIGAIPGLSFIETVRASAFRMTLPSDVGNDDNGGADIADDTAETEDHSESALS